ncbi:hypothetical protein LSH36_510g02022 [Paralvinella palmiformis]|uniref:Uncharacterized protein n=1 Tax=Paralvinella palmiformis TaxID=53620 RepID=A0AAD9J827_9ANNE|nr:hypothetical protein LSH36_510g02022 [Paralvinella palmiformis]
MGIPFTTSSPVDEDDVTTNESEKLSTALVQEKDVCMKTKQLNHLEGQQMMMQHNRDMVSPVSTKFKPHVPRRFVKPKLVILPKERKNGLKAPKKPSRPPPPVPNEINSVYDYGENVPFEQDAINVNVVLSEKHGSDHVHISDQKRKTLSRPKEPPPPAPGGTVILSNDTSKVHISSSGHNGKIPNFVQTFDDQDYEDVEPGLQLGLLNTDRKPCDSGLGFDNSIPSVHTSARLEHVDKSKAAVTESSESVIDFSRLDSLDCDKSSFDLSPAGEIEKDVPPATFSAILDIFERIVQKDDPPTQNTRVRVFHGDSVKQAASCESINGLMIKPVLPPKPTKNQQTFRRTQSEPDLLGLSLASESHLPGIGFNPDCVNGVDDDSSSILDIVKPVIVSKPALPPRPKMPPHRSRSLGSLLLANGANDLVLATEIEQTEAVGKTSNVEPNIVSNKPEKSSQPADELLKLNMDKKETDSIINISHGSKKDARDEVKKAASQVGDDTFSSSTSLEQVNVISMLPKPGLASIDAQIKSDACADKEQSQPPPRPIQPPTKSPTSLISKSPTSHTDKSVITQHSNFATVSGDKSPTTQQMDRITHPQFNKIANNQVDKPASVSKEQTRTPVMLWSFSQQKSNGDTIQRKKIPSNGSIMISSSPEAGEKHLHSLSDSKLGVTTIRDVSKPSLTFDSLNVTQGVTSTSHYSEPSLHLLPPLQFSTPRDILASQSTEPEVGNKTMKSSKAVAIDVKQNPHTITTPATKAITTPVNIRTSHLRFFTPVGFSRSGSSSSVSSSNITISSATTSSIGSLSPDSTITDPTSLKANGTYMEVEHHVTAPQMNGNLLSISKSSSHDSTSNSTITKKASPMQFYTPLGYNPHRRRISVDDLRNPQTDISSSEQNLSTQPSGEETEKFGSTGSLDYSGPDAYQPYAGVEIKSVIKRRLTPPRPFMPSRWSGYGGLRKDRASLATVDIEIEDSSNSLNEERKTNRKTAENVTRSASNKSSLLLISQTDLESDV